MHRIYTFLIFISQLALGLSNNPDIPIQYELANNIMENYQKGLIPKVRKGSPINVTLSLQLYQIIQVVSWIFILKVKTLFFKIKKWSKTSEFFQFFSKTLNDYNFFKRHSQKVLIHN